MSQERLKKELKIDKSDSRISYYILIFIAVLLCIMFLLYINIENRDENYEENFWNFQHYHVKDNDRYICSDFLVYTETGKLTIRNLSEYGLDIILCETDSEIDDFESHYIAPGGIFVDFMLNKDTMYNLYVRSLQKSDFDMLLSITS